MLHLINSLTKLSGGKIDVYTLNFHFFTEHEKICHQSPYSIDYALRKRCYAFVTAAAAESPSLWHWICIELRQKLCLFFMYYNIDGKLGRIINAIYVNGYWLITLFSHWFVAMLSDLIEFLSFLLTHQYPICSIGTYK